MLEVGDAYKKKEREKEHLYMKLPGMGDEGDKSQCWILQQQRRRKGNGPSMNVMTWSEGWFGKIRNAPK